MKIAHLLAVVTCCLAIGLTGCGGTKYGKKGVGVGDEPPQTMGLEEEETFNEYGISEKNRLKAPYNQSYHFDLNRYEVKPYDIESIDVQGNYLIANPNARIRLEGNADERGSREYNITLGWKRAKAVAALLKQQGVSDSQIALVSYGKEKPIALGHNEEAYKQNRRTDLIYEAK